MSRVPSRMTDLVTEQSWLTFAFRVRKIKCDEGKPSCTRCESTGRKCDGYAEVAAIAAKGQLWYRPRTAFQGVDDAAELWALQRFTEGLSPVLAGPLDPYFWTHLVMQFSHFEPAVRHSLVAISALYDQPTSLLTNRPKLADNAFALHHYNAAIRELRTMCNEPLVLLVCVLFTCIEVLQGDAAAAAAHCRHGTVILAQVQKAYPWARQYLAPIFRRFNVMPFFFGQPRFPKMTELDDPIPTRFHDLADAQLHLDGIVNRGIHLLRYGMIERASVADYTSLPIPQGIIDEQLDLMRRLIQWHTSFAPLHRAKAAGSRTDMTTCAHMLFMADSAQIWVETTLKDDEMMHDEYLPVFQRLLARAASVDHLLLSHNTGAEAGDASDNDSGSRSDSGSSGGDGRRVSQDEDLSLAATERPKFTFEMGFMPGLYYVILKCRCLRTRLRALTLLRTASTARESLWSAAVHYTSGKRAIELEHQIELGDDELPLTALTPEEWDYRPPDERRIRSTDSATDLSIRTDTDTGQTIYERRVVFYYSAPGGGYNLLTEMIPEVPNRYWL